MSYVTKRIRLIVPANKAKPSPSIGQALGSVGINMMKFCKEFNAKTVSYIDDLPLRVQLSIMNDGTYSFTTSIPQSSWFIKKMAGVEVLAHQPGHEIVGIVHSKQLYHLAQLKKEADQHNEELQAAPLQSIFRSLVHSCKSYGIEVQFDQQQEREKRKKEEEEKKQKLAASAVVSSKKKKKTAAGGKSTTANPASAAAASASAKPAAGKKKA